MLEIGLIPISFEPLLRRGAALAAALAAVAAVAGCGSTSRSAGSGRIDVVATTTELADLVRAVGGDAVDVHGILRPNTDPHDYEPRPDDVVRTAAADLVVTSGDGLDSWARDLVADAGGRHRVLDAGRGRPVALPGESSGAEASRYDPHWWHDPVNAQYAVRRIAAALIAADPRAAPGIRARTRAYLARLRRLDRGIRACLAAVPPAQRKLVTDHDAFGYFARRYGIDVVGAVIPSQATAAQPSAGALADLSALIRREHVTAVFPESSVNARLARALARQTGATADHTLYGDTLGPAGSRGATYLGMEAANADALVRGFTGGRRGCAIAARP